MHEEQLVDIPYPRPRACRKSASQRAFLKQFVDIPASQIQERIVEVMQFIPQISHAAVGP